VRGLHSSKAAGLLALFAATTACKGQGATLRSIRVNVVKACVPSSAAATANLLPSGDFPRLAQSVPMPLDQMGARIDIPLDTRALLATLGPSLLGVTDVAAAGDVDLLMWPTETVCQLTTTVPFEPGEALGLVDAQHALPFIEPDAQLAQAGERSQIQIFGGRCQREGPERTQPAERRHDGAGVRRMAQKAPSRPGSGRDPVGRPDAGS